MFSRNLYINTGVFLLCLLGFHQVSAQKTLSSRDTGSIGAATRNIMGELRQAMLSMADQTNSESDRKDIAAHYLEQPDNIFYSKKVFIDDDTDPDNTVPEKSLKEAEDYLVQFNQFYRTDKDNTIEITIKSVSPILRAANKMPYVKVHYSQLFKAKSSQGKSYTKVYRIAEIYFEKKGEGNQWRAYIGSIKFEDRNAPPDDVSTAIPLATDGSAQEPELREVKDESYYRSLLVKGTHALADNKYADAYRYLREARESDKVSAEANGQFNSLKMKVKSSVTMETDSFFHAVLKSKGRAMNNAGRYEEAKKYYAYAKECDLMDKTIPPVIADLDGKVAVQRSLDDLFRKGLYEQAIPGYNEAIKSDPGNADLYTGRAKCYWKLYKNTEARNDFYTAIKRDDANPDIYLWQGRFYESMNEKRYFDSAYACLVNYVNKSEYKDDPALVPIYSEAAFCKGMSLYYNRTFIAAIDSFKSAINLNPKFTAAHCYLGCCYYEVKDNAKALETLEAAKNIDDKYPDAHYWYGKTLRQKDWTRHTHEAIREMKLAIDLLSTNMKSPNWFQWNSDLGDILQRNKNYEDAVKYYTNCINIDPKRNFLYYLYRGECYFHWGQSENAGRDYYEYKKWCDTYGTQPNPALDKDLKELNGTK